MPSFTILDWDKQKIGEILAEEISDGYHTFGELYNHRHALFCALIKAYDGLITPMGPSSVSAWKSKVHHDGSMYPGFFIAGLTKRNLDESLTHISYHLPITWWDRVRCIEIIAAPEYDGYTSDDVINRLVSL